MKGKPNSGRQARRFLLVLAFAALLFTAAPILRADDLTTLSGQTFHAVRAIRVEPDGVTWTHDGGVVKVDFSDSPRSVQQAYGYNPAKAAAYHDARVQTQHQAEEQSRQLLRADEERRLARAQSQSAAPATGPVPASTDPTSGAPTLVYRHGLAETVHDAARSLDEQADNLKAKAAAVAEASEGLLGDPKLWKYFPGVGSAPRLLRTSTPQKEEYKVSLHGDPTDGTKSALESNFYNPLYMTKTYNEDVDRAAAFARGIPLK